MSPIVTISDELAAALEARRRRAGLPSLDAAAEALLADALAQGDGAADDLGLPEESLRALIAEGEASGPPVDRDGRAVREEVRRRFAAGKAGWGRDLRVVSHPTFLDDLVDA